MAAAEAYRHGGRGLQRSLSCLGVIDRRVLHSLGRGVPEADGQLEGRAGDSEDPLWAFRRPRRGRLQDHTQGGGQDEDAHLSGTGLCQNADQHSGTLHCQ